MLRLDGVLFVCGWAKPAGPCSVMGQVSCDGGVGRRSPRDRRLTDGAGDVRRANAIKLLLRPREGEVGG